MSVLLELCEFDLVDGILHLQGVGHGDLGEGDAGENPATPRHLPSWPRADGGCAQWAQHTQKGGPITFFFILLFFTFSPKPKL